MSRLLGHGTVVGSGLAVASLGLTLDNLRRLRVPPAAPSAGVARGVDLGAERVAVLLPVRDEARHVERVVPQLVRAARRWPGPARVVVLDDGSTDGTGRLLAGLAARDDLADVLEVVDGMPLPPGWLGKPWACRQLAALASEAEVLVFVDADVELDEDAVTATVGLLRTSGLDLVSPYPRQDAGSPAERLVQPLLAWSWMSTLPLGVAERSPRPSMTAANGQLLAVDAAAYHRAGGHLAVRGAVLEDLALLRAVKATGGSGGVADGSRLASCRMYDGWAELRAGYGKSLWAAFGSGPGAVAVGALLATTYVLPPLAALRGSRVGLVGYLAGVASRALVARRTHGSAGPDPWAHPVSVLVLLGLTVDSFVGRRRGRLGWKGRRVEVGSGAGSGAGS